MELECLYVGECGGKHISETLFFVIFYPVNDLQLLWVPCITKIDILSDNCNEPTKKFTILEISIQPHGDPSPITITPTIYPRNRTNHLTNMKPLQRTIDPNFAKYSHIITKVQTLATYVTFLPITE